jgi:hypothetical protein
MITGLGGGGSEVGVAMLRDLAVNLRAMFSLLRWNGCFSFDCVVEYTFTLIGLNYIMHNQVLAWQNVGSTKKLTRGEPA